MKKTYIKPNIGSIEFCAKGNMLIAVSATEAASDAEVFGRENSENNFWSETE